jgi:putative flavoprotein involved in K+ transport
MNAFKLPGDSITAIPPGILQIHSMDYRNPAAFAGAVLVIGTGQSGAKLPKNGTRGRSISPSAALDVCHGNSGRDIDDGVPSRMGMFDTKIGELKSPRAKFAPHPQISGKNGGESLNLHQFTPDGVVLLGHVRGAGEGRVMIAPDMKQMLAQVDQFELDALKMVDSYIARIGLNAPAEVVPQLRNGYEQGEPTH